MTPDLAAQVSVAGALAHYESLRGRYRADPSLTRTEAINRAMFDLWLSLLVPYRVFSQSDAPDGIIRWHVVLDHNDKNYGSVTRLWMLRGQHRERDAVRLSTVLRNQFVLGVQDRRQGYPLVWPDVESTKQRNDLISRLSAQHPDPVIE